IRSGGRPSRGSICGFFAFTSAACQVSPHDSTRPWAVRRPSVVAACFHTAPGPSCSRGRRSVVPSPQRESHGQTSWKTLRSHSRPVVGNVRQNELRRDPRHRGAALGGAREYHALRAAGGLAIALALAGLTLSRAPREAGQNLEPRSDALEYAVLARRLADGDPPTLPIGEHAYPS